MMTKKHFDALAKQFAQLYQRFRQQGYNRWDDVFCALDEAVAAVGAVCEDSNDLFDLDRFISAAGAKWTDEDQLNHAEYVKEGIQNAMSDFDDN